MTAAANEGPAMRIGQLAERFALNPKTIRYYEDIGLLPEPERTAGGYRLYSDADADRLGFIRTAQRLSLTLDDIREILAFKERGEAPCTYVLGLLHQQAQDLERRITEMQALRDELLVLVDQAGQLPASAAGFCQLIEHRLEGCIDAGRTRRGQRPVTEETFQVKRIRGQGCERVIRLLGAVDGVARVDADFTTNLVTIAYDAGRVTTRTLRAELADAGYPVVG